MRQTKSFVAVLLLDRIATDTDHIEELNLACVDNGFQEYLGTDD